MKWKVALPILILAGAVATAVVLTAMRPTPTRVIAEPPALLVQVAEATREPVSFKVHSHGTVMPRTETTIVAEASGQIVAVADDFVSGGFFQKGSVLIQIDPRNYEADVKRAQANLARANTQFATQATLQGYARSDWEKLKRLNTLDPAVGKPQVQEAIAAVQSAEADLVKAQGDLARTTIRAPYDGIIREKRVDVGQYVNTGSQLAVTFAVDIAEVRLPVTQGDLEYLDLEKLILRDPIEVSLSADMVGGKRVWPGRITRSEGVFDPDSRVLYLVAQIDDPYTGAGTGAMLLMGTFVAAEITGRDGGDLIRIPRYSLQRGNTVWVVDDEARIRPRQVEIAGRDNEYVYVGTGLEDGERYCVTPIDNPLPGMKVRFSG